MASLSSIPAANGTPVSAPSSMAHNRHGYDLQNPHPSKPSTRSNGGGGHHQVVTMEVTATAEPQVQAQAPGAAQQPVVDASVIAIAEHCPPPLWKPHW